MLHSFAFFALGFLTAVVAALFILENTREAKDRQIRQWRKEALAAKSNADFWQTAYSKDATK